MRGAPDGFLFDASPDTDVDNAKKKKFGKTRAKSRDVTAITHYESEYSTKIIASVEDHYECDRCGLRVLDLVDIRGPKWLVCCGWNCLHYWEVDPVPGLLDAQDTKKSPKGELDDFVVRDPSRFNGRTFGDIWDSDEGWYIELLAEVGRPFAKEKRTALREAARKFLQSKKGLTDLVGSTDTMTHDHQGG